MTVTEEKSEAPFCFYCCGNEQCIYKRKKIFKFCKMVQKYMICYLHINKKEILVFQNILYRANQEEYNLYIFINKSLPFYPVFCCVVFFHKTLQDQTIYKWLGFLALNLLTSWPELLTKCLRKGRIVRKYHIINGIWNNNI